MLRSRQKTVVSGIDWLGWFTYAHLGQRRDYARALKLYRTRDWVCQLTGRSGLSYEEALVSEQRSRTLIAKVCRRYGAISTIRTPLSAWSAGASCPCHKSLGPSPEALDWRQDGTIRSERFTKPQQQCLQTHYGELYYCAKACEEQQLFQRKPGRCSHH